MKEDFENLFLSKREKERRRAEARNREKQEQEDEPPVYKKSVTTDFDTLVKLVNQNAFLEPL